MAAIERTTMSVRAEIDRRPDGFHVKVRWEKRVTSGGVVRRTGERREFGPFDRPRANRLVKKFEEGFFNALL
jgi:hypothetical protein